MSQRLTCISPSPGARLAGKDLFSLCGVLMAEVGGSFTIFARPGPVRRRQAAPADESRAAALDAERLARACWALALFTEVYRSRLVARSPLGLLDPAAKSGGATRPRQRRRDR